MAVFQDGRKYNMEILEILVYVSFQCLVKSAAMIFPFDIDVLCGHVIVPQKICKNRLRISHMEPKDT